MLSSHTRLTHEDHEFASLGLISGVSTGAGIGDDLPFIDADVNLSDKYLR